MPIELRKQRDGRPRKTWYGRYEVNGRVQIVNLDVKVAGTPPSSLSLRDEGDAAFERSRATAQAKLDHLVEEARSTTNSARLVEKIYEIKTGETFKAVKLDSLPEEWKRIPRRRELDQRYTEQCESTLRRFIAFVRSQNSAATDIAQVTRTMARAFMDAEAGRGITGKTWNDTLKLVRATFKHLLPAGAINPFSGIPTKETETVFRVPFTPEQLKAILEVVREDDFTRPIVIVAMCTAMRRGDCCLLKGEDVDLVNGFINVKTSKTGQMVTIPIFPMLAEELHRHEIKSGHYVFPKQAETYLRSSDAITSRVKRALGLALGDAASPQGLPNAALDEVRARAHKLIGELAPSNKRERMLALFNAYASGKSLAEAASEAGVSKGTASHHLNQIQSGIGCRVLRGGSGRKGTGVPRQADELLNVERKGGKRRASIRDFHSFRVTWVTLALTAGVPLELVRKVTGHQTADIVLKHYYQPGREMFRQALHAAMPKLLTNAPASPKEEIREVLQRATATTWERDKARLLTLLERL